MNDQDRSQHAGIDLLLNATSIIEQDNPTHQPQVGPSPVSSPPQANPSLAVTDPIQQTCLPAIPISKPLLDQFVINLQSKFPNLNKLKVRFDNEFQKTLGQTKGLFSEDRSKSQPIIDSAKKLAPYNIDLLTQYKNEGNMENAFALLFLINVFNKGFEKFFRGNEAKFNPEKEIDESIITKINKSRESIEYILDNFDDKFIPLLEVFSIKSLTSMLYLQDSQKAEDTLTNFSRLINLKAFGYLGKLFPNSDAMSSFISSASNGIEQSYLILETAMKKTDELKTIIDKGYDSKNLSQIFCLSRYNFSNNIETFVRNLDSIEKNIYSKEFRTLGRNVKRDKFCQFLSKISKSFGELIPLLCEVDFFNIISPEDITSARNDNRSRLSIYKKFEEKSEKFGVTKNFLGSLARVLNIEQEIISTEQGAISTEQGAISSEKATEDRSKLISVSALLAPLEAPAPVVTGAMRASAPAQVDPRAMRASAPAPVVTGAMRASAPAQVDPRPMRVLVRAGASRFDQSHQYAVIERQIIDDGQSKPKEVRNSHTNFQDFIESLEKAFPKLYKLKNEFEYEFKHKYKKTLQQTKDLFSEDPSKSQSIIDSAKKLAPYNIDLLTQYKNEGNMENAFALLFLINVFEGKFDSLFRGNEAKFNPDEKITPSLITKINKSRESIEYILDNFDDKFTPLLEVFSIKSLTSMLYLQDSKKANDTLTNFSRLIKLDAFGDLRELFDNGDVMSSFISSASNGGEKPYEMLETAMNNIDKLREIRIRGYSYPQINKIFNNSRGNFESQLLAFTQNLDSIETLIYDKNEATKNKKREDFCSFLSRISRDFDTLIPLFCSVDLFNIFTNENGKIEFPKTYQGIVSKFIEKRGICGIDEEKIESLETILIASQIASQISGKKRSRQEISYQGSQSSAKMPSPSCEPIQGQIDQIGLSRPAR